MAEKRSIFCAGCGGPIWYGDPRWDHLDDGRSWHPMCVKIAADDRGPAAGDGAGEATPE